MKILLAKRVYNLHITFSHWYFDFFFMNKHALNLQLQELFTYNIFFTVFCMYLCLGAQLLCLQSKPYIRWTPPEDLPSCVEREILLTKLPLILLTL